jgi:phage baseplate assembly protein W
MAFLNYIGTGVEYPLKVKSGAFKIETGTTLLEMSMIQILDISKGSLPHNPYFGSDLFRLIHEPVDAIVKSAGTTFIVESIKQWERRVQITDITAETVSRVGTVNGFEKMLSLVEFLIKYRVLASNEVQSFVFPFYRELEF